MQCLSALSAMNLFAEVRDTCLGYKQTFQPRSKRQISPSVLYFTPVFSFLTVPVLYQDNGRHPQPRLRAELPPPALLPPPSLHPHVEARRLQKLGPKEPGPLPG